MYAVVSDFYNDQFEKYYNEYEEFLMPKTSLDASDLKIIKVNNFFEKKIQRLVKNKNQKIRII